MKWDIVLFWLLASAAMGIAFGYQPADATPDRIIPDHQVVVFGGHGMRCVHVAKPGTGLKSVGGALSCVGVWATHPRHDVPMRRLEVR